MFDISFQGVAEMKHEIIERFPGISCAWMDAGRKTATECCGVADKEKLIPVDNSTVFPACSISKFITALCIMKLHEQKLLDVDMPVNQYLQQWKLISTDGNESDAAIRYILSHTAGIVDGEDSFFGLRMGDPEIGLMDILKGTTSYNSRPVRAEKPQGTAFEYSDAGYCVLQLLIEEVTHKAFDDSVRDILSDPLGLSNTFFATPGNITRFQNRMATGYDDNGLPIPGRFPPVPDLAASGLWSTPKELLSIADEYLKAFHGESSFLRAESAREMAKPAKDFPWTGLGVFNSEENILSSSGWGENGQCMMKMNCRTREISVVMANRTPGADQAESGIEWLVNSRFSR